MSIWIIEPYEPLIFRDGRPFGPHPGVRAHSLPFPVPSTTTGAVRTQIGLDEHGVFTWTSQDQLDRLKRLQVRGPLLIQLPEPGDNQEELCWFAPAPADALLLKPDKKLQAEEPKVIADLRRLVPLKIDDALTDLPSLTKQLGDPLHLVGSTRRIEGKTVDEPPSFWHRDAFQKWLLHPSECKISNWNDLGIPGPQSELRVHTSIDGEHHTARYGALFETRGMEFIASDKEKAMFNAHQLALAVSVGDNDSSSPTLEPRPGFSKLGGERRMVYWWRSNKDLPQCPEKLIEQIKDGKWACRVILLTPAYFEYGCYPKELLKEEGGVKPKLIALAVNRPQVVSGWDFTDKSDGRSQGRPKKTRRLAPAGSVLFLELQGSKAAIEKWVKATWMHCIGDDEQLCRDGFGLAVVGTWDGLLQDMEKEK